MRIAKTFERNIESGLSSLQLRMSHRWDVPEDYEQNFAAIISIEDPYDKLDVYGEIINEVGVRYTPIVEV